MQLHHMHSYNLSDGFRGGSRGTVESPLETKLFHIFLGNSEKMLANCSN